MLLAGASTAPAQEPFPLGQYRLDAWTAENGLRGNQVLPRLIQSPDGYLWMMARNGLTRFDGVNFTTYNADNTPLFRGSSNRQRPLLLDRRGRVVIATATGFVFYENGRFLEGPRYEGGMLQAAQDGDGTYWSLSTTATLFRSVRTARGVRMEEFSHPGLPDAAATGIAVDGEGALWVGFAEGGTVRIRHGGSARPAVRAFTTRDGLPSDQIIWLMQGQRGAIWISAPGTVTRVGGGGAPRVERVLDTGADDEMHDVIALAEEPDGTTWLATAWSGLLRFDPRDGSMQRVTRRHGLAHDRVTGLLLDPHGSIWASTPLGLNRIRRVDFAAVSRPDSLALTANCVLRTPDGTGWLGTERGELFRARGGDLAGPLDRVALAPEGFFLSMSPGRGGALWLALGQGGTVRVAGTSARRVRTDFTDAVLEDGSGTLWVSSLEKGLTRVRGGRETHFGPDVGTFRLRISHIVEGRPGVIWGGGPEGVARFENDTLRGYRNEPGGTDSVSLRSVVAMHRDRAGTVWIGTNDGLTRATDTPAGPRFVTLRTRQGLPENWVTDIVEDERGHLWLVGADGITRVAIGELNAVADGRKPVLAGVRVFGLRDGVPSGGEAVGGGCERGAVGPDGRLWYAMQRGLFVVDPDRLLRDTIPPQARVLEALVDGVPLPSAGRISIPAGARRLELRYTGVHLRAGDEVVFQHRLEGFDPDWVDAGTTRTVSYTSLPPGTYRFHLRARNTAGVWSPRAATVELRALPPFYRTWWFLGLAAVAVLAALWAANRARERVLRARFAAVLAERTRVAREMHDTLLSAMAGFALRLHAAAHRAGAAQPAVAAELSEMADTAQNVLTEARRALHDLRAPEADGDLQKKLEDTARRVFAGSPVEIRVESAGPPWSPPPEVRLQIVRIVQEALTNARKHAGCSRVTLTSTYRPDQLGITVQDDGRGFAVADAPPRDHWGLTGMRERAQEIGGRLTVHSEPGEGTTVTLVVPGAASRWAARPGEAAVPQPGSTAEPGAREATRR
jgi:signal transduction histidine kinase/ligand-binding sensor domain-containing protein